MSAIFGLVNLDGRPAARAELDLMGAALAVHGPDGGDVWIGDGVGLGQRLMRFTPEDRLERQPLAGAEGHHVLVADGRVDNRPELMHELGIPASEANEMPDSAFILRSYEKWGSDCCGHLVGNFVFALCDLHEGYVLIARSAGSDRSLFYHAAPEIFAFASAPKGLFALPRIPREIDQENLADYLLWVPRERGRSFYAGLRELQAGEAIIVRRERLSLQKFWQPDLLRETRFPRDSDYVEAFNTLFDRVIADHSRSLTPVGVMMSGGLDSSSVGVTAARFLAQQGKRLAAFTEVPRAGFDAVLKKNRYADETPFVQAIARKCENLDLNFVRTDRVFLDGIDPCFDALEVPIRGAWGRTWWEAILRQAGCQNVRVLLTGQPGNFTISREGEGLFPQLIRKGKWIEAFREAQACARQNGGTSALAVLAGGGARLLPLPLWVLTGRLLRRDNPVFRASPAWRAYSPIHPEFARFHRVAERAHREGHDFYYRVPYETRADRYESIRRWDPGLQVTRGYEAMFGVQTRNPAGDVRMIEFCLSVPEEQFLLDGISRSLIRRAMKDRLPQEVLANKRRGLQAADWFEGANASRNRMLDELARLECSELAPLALDLKWIRQLVEEMPKLGGRPVSAPLDYKAILGTAFMTGSFLRWFELSGGTAN